MNLTDDFLKKIDALFAQKIPDQVYQRARIALLDYLAVSVAGTAGQKEHLDNYLRETDPEAGAIAAIGLEGKFVLKEAVFLNGLNAHALDLDDGVNEGIIHLGSPIFSVLLPLAQKYPVTLEKLLKAAIIGYETAFTVAASIQPRHKELGYHATGSCGVLGIALAVSYLLDFGAAERKNAFAAACVSAGAVLNVLDDGSELKPYNVAKAALQGLIACQMGKAGFAGPPDPLGGERGFLKMMTREEKTVLRQPLSGGRYAIEKTYTKPFAACRYCHPAIEAAIRIRRQYEIKPEAIDSVELRTYFWAVDRHDHTDIPGAASAKMSIPYGVALGLIKGKAGLNEYSEQYIADPAVQSLLSKITVVADPELTAIFPVKQAAVLNLRTKDGEQFTERIDEPKGEPENPLTAEEFEQRFIDLYAFAGRRETAARRVLDYVQTISGEQEFEYEQIS